MHDTKTVTISGKDPYFLTAVIAAECASKLHSGTDTKAGVISASMLDGFAFIKSAMEAEGVIWGCD